MSQSPRARMSKSAPKPEALQDCRLYSKVRRMGPYYGPLGLLGVHLRYIVGRYVRIPGLRAF